MTRSTATGPPTSTARRGHGSDATPRWDAAFWDERYGSSEALWSGHVNAVVRDEAGAAPWPGARRRLW